MQGDQRSLVITKANKKSTLVTAFDAKHCLLCVQQQIEVNIRGKQSTKWDLEGALHRDSISYNQLGQQQCAVYYLLTFEWIWLAGLQQDNCSNTQLSLPHPPDKWNLEKCLKETPPFFALQCIINLSNKSYGWKNYYALRSDIDRRNDYYNVSKHNVMLFQRSQFI